MKKTYYIPLALAASLMFLSVPAEAQTVVVTTWESTFPDDGIGSAAERDSILSLYHEEVTMKNEYIISTRHLTHEYGSDSRDWVVMTEYESWNDIAAAVRRDGELFREHWATGDERQEFFRVLSKYFGHHSDEIYNVYTQVAK